jgi:hypothetical protein
MYSIHDLFPTASEQIWFGRPKSTSITPQKKLDFEGNFTKKEDILSQV